ncbi:MAG: hypothetical protein IJS15_08330, partial [Victivallales bacterium]|nr:hypothetical protein [Victivallales bacterium]
SPASRWRTSPSCSASSSRPGKTCADALPYLLSSPTDQMDNLPDIMPLFWLRGEPLDVIESEIRAMHGAGLRGFIVEARPFPDYMGDFWWETLDLIMRTAEELGMKVVIFDDRLFPSGYAGGIIAEKHPEHLKTLIEMKERNFSGKTHFTPDEFLTDGDKRILKVIALPMLPDGRFKCGGEREFPVEECDIDLPQGEWKLTVWVLTRNGGESHTHNYINIISHSATRSYIDEIYVPHVERYRRYIGKTFVGFFNDEPRIANEGTYYAIIGKRKMHLPYIPEIPMDKLPHLEFDSDDAAATGKARLEFMDFVSRAYSRNFSDQIGDYCRSNGLIYIGHIVEDNGAHCRLGYSNGHFFRSMSGQDWAGLDTVLGQNIPDHTDGIRNCAFGPMDDTFFNWGLVKLGASCGELRRIPVVQEIFGAYGWSEDLSRMKWHSDFAFVRGVNRLIPHAYSNAEFPDKDCPPHFHARGSNPQWPFFPLWLKYAERMMLHLSGGHRAPSPAVLYHAEAEWFHGERILHNEEVIGALAKHQIDCGIIPFDSLDDVTVHGGLGVAGDMHINTLIVNDITGLPESYLARIASFKAKGLPVLEITADDLPRLHELVPPSTVRFDSYQPTLRAMHYIKDGEDIFMLFNESMNKHVQCNVLLPLADGLFAVDPIDGAAHPFEGSLRLAPNESILLTQKAENVSPAPRMGEEICRFSSEALPASL